MMLTRTAKAVSLTAAVIAVASFSATAQDAPTHVETHHMTVEHKDAAETDAEHQASAQRFENEAAEFDKQSAEHEQMAKDYRRQARLNPKANYVALADHCDRLAKDLKSSAAEAREIAHLHHDVAKLVGK